VQKSFKKSITEQSAYLVDLGAYMCVLCLRMENEVFRVAERDNSSDLKAMIPNFLQSKLTLQEQCDKKTKGVVFVL